MVKTRSQQKMIPFSNRKSKSRSKSEIQSGDSDETKSCCLATLSRVCRERSKDADSIDQRSPFDASPAKRKKAKGDALPSRSVSRQNLYDKENESTRSDSEEENQFLVANTIGRKASKCMMIRPTCVDVSSKNDEDCVFHDGSPSICTSRPIHTGIKSRTSLSLTASEKRRHSSLIDQERLALPNKRLLSCTKTCNEARPYSMSSTALPICTRKKQSHSCSASENSTPHRQLLRIGLQDGQMYKEAKHVLHSAIPSTLLCRETEVKQINTFLKNCLVNKHPGSLYISGAPGTGKTACLTHILEQLKKQDFDYQVQFINCMNISQSHRIYSKIAEELTGWDKLTNMEAEKFLEKKFTTKGSPIVLVLDEIDQLESKNQDVLYTMFEWPSLPSSRLILIGIANALDLTDRVLPRLQLRKECKPKLLHFSPYSKDQIVKILTTRLSEVEGSSVVDVSAVQFCARKIAAVSGDMRKALDICRRAVEVVESEVKRQQILKSIERTASPKKAAMKKVTIAHVSKVISDVYGSRIVKSCGEQPTIPLQQKILMCTILLMQKESKLREIPIGQLHETYCSICKKRQVSRISQEDCLSLCNLLETRGIISMKRAKETRMTKVSLKIDEKEVDYALQDKILLSSILQAGLTKE